MVPSEEPPLPTGGGVEAIKRRRNSAAEIDGAGSERMSGLGIRPLQRALCGAASNSSWELKLRDGGNGVSRGKRFPARPKLERSKWQSRKKTIWGRHRHLLPTVGEEFRSEGETP